MPKDWSALARAAVAAKARNDDTPEKLLGELASDGFEVETDGVMLSVRPKSRLTAEQMERVKRHKPAILKLLAPPKPPEGWDAEKADKELAAGLARVDALERLAPEPGLLLWDCERTVLRRFHATFSVFLFDSECVHLAIRRNILEARK